MRAKLIRLCVLAVGLAVLSPPAAAKDAPDQRLQEVERALETDRQNRAKAERAAKALARQIAKVTARQVATAKTLQQAEAEVSRLEIRLQELARETAQAQARLKDHQAQYGQVLTALQRLSRLPPEAVIAQPLALSEMMRGAVLLKSAVPEIERRSKHLRTTLAELDRLTETTRRRQEQLAAATSRLDDERRRLDALFTEKKAMRRDALDESRAAARRMAALAREAGDLRDLLDRLEADRVQREREKHEAQTARAHATPSRKPIPPATALDMPISKARGRLPFPAVGHVVGQYGEMTGTGLTRKGIAIETRPDAQVIAPHAGQVVFAGPFRGYGQLLILEHGEGYHSLLAGLARIDTSLGHRLQTGEPVGRMGPSNNADPVLYVEFRRNGQPINPLPWLALLEGRENG